MTGPPAGLGRDGLMDKHINNSKNLRIELSARHFVRMFGGVVFLRRETSQQNNEAICQLLNFWREMGVSVTNHLLFLLVAAIVFVIFAARENNKFRSVLQRKPKTLNLLPKAITLLVVTAQASELVKIIEHVSLPHIIVALFLLAVISALKSGTESELY